MFKLLFDAAFFVGGAIVGAGGLAALKAKAKSDVAALLADAKAEIAKVSPDIKTIASKIEAAIAKL